MDPTQALLALDPARSEPKDMLRQRPVVSRVRIPSHDSRRHDNIRIQTRSRAGEDFVRREDVDVCGRHRRRLEGVVCGGEDDAGGGLDAVKGVQGEVVFVRDFLGEFFDAGVDVGGVFADVDAVVYGGGDAFGEGVYFDAAVDDVDGYGGLWMEWLLVIGLSEYWGAVFS